MSVLPLPALWDGRWEAGWLVHWRQGVWLMTTAWGPPVDWDSERALVEITHALATLSRKLSSSHRRGAAASAAYCFVMAQGAMGLALLGSQVAQSSEEQRRHDPTRLFACVESAAVGAATLLGVLQQPAAGQVAERAQRRAWPNKAAAATGRGTWPGAPSGCSASTSCCSVRCGSRGWHETCCPCCWSGRPWRRSAEQPQQQLSRGGKSEQEQQREWAQRRAGALALRACANPSCACLLGCSEGRLAAVCRRCSCGAARFCSVQCQREGWEAHCAICRSA